MAGDPEEVRKAREARKNEGGDSEEAEGDAAEALGGLSLFEEQ